MTGWRKRQIANLQDKEFLMNHIEAMKQMVEALERADKISGYPNNKEAIAVGRQAIAKAEKQEQPAQQEPFGWYSAQVDEFMTHKTRMEHERLNSYTHKVGGFDLPLYTRPQAREPLTDEQCDAIYTALDKWAREFDPYEFGLPNHCGDEIVGGRAIIRAAHGIKEKNMK